MKARLIDSKAVVLLVASILVSVSAANAATINVMTSGGLTAAYKEVVPEFERMTKHTVETAWGSSTGGEPDSIPSRLQRGEPADVVIVASTSLDELIKQGKVVNGSRVDLARSSIGMVVRAGAPKPDISTVEAFKRTLLEAKSIAYSASASGIYLSEELFPRLGIAEQIKDKSKRIPRWVGRAVASGDAEIGFQQISELLPIPGVDLVGPLPPELQKVTIFSAGIATGAKEPEAGKALIKFLASQAAAPAIAKSGMEPVTSKEQEPATSKKQEPATVQ